jgi:hypothetical protein
MDDRPIFFGHLALPVSWDMLDRAPSDDERDAAASANATLFNFLLHGIELDAAHRPADERLAEALAPLRTKLDIVIEMLGRLSYRGITVPPMRDVELGVTRMAWRSPTALRVEDWLRIRLYFDPVFLEPVVRFGRVASAVADDGGSFSVQAELGDIAPDAEEAFARLAFLAQRRQLGQRPGQSAARAR